MKWQQLSPTGAAPVGCAAHSAVAVGKHLYVFGGMTPTGALDTMYQYHIGELGTLSPFQYRNVSYKLTPCLGFDLTLLCKSQGMLSSGRCGHLTSEPAHKKICLPFSVYPIKKKNLTKIPRDGTELVGNDFFQAVTILVGLFIVLAEHFWEFLDMN